MPSFSTHRFCDLVFTFVLFFHRFWSQPSYTVVQPYTYVNVVPIDSIVRSFCHASATAAFHHSAFTIYHNGMVLPIFCADARERCDLRLHWRRATRRAIRAATRASDFGRASCSIFHLFAESFRLLRLGCPRGALSSSTRGVVALRGSDKGSSRYSIIRLRSAAKLEIARGAAIDAAASDAGDAALSESECRTSSASPLVPTSLLEA